MTINENIDALTDESILRMIGLRVRNMRLQRNLKRSVMAREAGVSEKTLQRMEEGESVRMSNYIRVLRFLGVLDQLLGVLPEVRPLPTDLVSSRKAARQRASGSSINSTEWTWDDE